MWHEFACLRQQPPLPLSHWWKSRREGIEGIDPGIWRMGWGGVFWNGSSKELPAACINRSQLAQRGNSICRELRCILFIEELLVIRPYTPSRPDTAGGPNIPLLQNTTTEMLPFPPPHPRKKKILLTRAQLVPVSLDGVLFAQ